MSVIDDVVAKYEIEELLAITRKAADEHDAEGYAAGFTEGGIWVRGAGAQIEGRSAIASFLAGIPTDRVMRHVSGGVIVRLLDASRASAHTQVVMYTGSSHQGTPVPLAAPEKVFDYNDELVKTDVGWRISSRVTTLIFAR